VLKRVKKQGPQARLLMLVEPGRAPVLRLSQIPQDLRGSDAL
jgi:hypothetical protein